VNWAFESFPQYMDQLRRAGPYLNVAVFAGHSVIRTAVMGADASTRHDPTPQELDAMKRLVREAIDAGAIGFASSFSPNHSGHGGLPMPSTIAGDDELAALVGVLGEIRRGVFMSATGPRATPDYMERLAQATGRPMFISTVLAMYTDAAPQRGLAMYERCAQAIDRGHEVYVQTSCQPLSFDFDLVAPYVLYSHDAFDAVKAAGGDPERLQAIYRDPATRRRFRENLANPAAGILFYGDWTAIELTPALPANAHLAERSVADAAAAAGADPVDFLFDFALSEGLATRLVGKFFNNRDEGVAPLLRHRAGVITLSDAGAHLAYLCDAAFGLHLLGHWVRETGTFTLAEAVRRLTSQPADLYRIPDRGRIAPGAWADLLLFDPATVGPGRLRSVADLPGGGRRMVRDGLGVQGVWVNGTRTVDGGGYVDLPRGPGQVLDRFAA
jgi:N-acyl-D-aspartate/D-glutamate deacylase